MLVVEGLFARSCQFLARVVFLELNAYICRDYEFKIRIMKEDLIRLKTAILAKEKGFDEVCAFIHYSYNETPYRKLSQNSDESIREFWFVTAPTQSHLQKWLRERHKLHIEIIYLELSKKWASEVCFYLKGTTPLDGDLGDSYENVLEKALYKSLKLI